MTTPAQNIAVIFTLQNWGDLENMRHPERVSDDPEDYQRCIARERGMELDICTQLGVPVAFALPNEDRMIRTTGFHKFLGELKIELENKSAPGHEWHEGRKVLLRAHCNDEGTAKQAISAAGMTPAIPHEDEDRALSWLEWIKPEFLGRRIEPMTMGEILRTEKLREFAGDATEVFLKTVEKHIHGVCHPNEPLDVIEYNCALLPPTTKFLVSEVMEIHEDEHGKQEWRIWVAKGKPTSFSRYLDYETNYETPQEVVDFAERFCRDQPDQPTAFVLDVAQTTKGVQVIEINPLQSSGRYGNNDFTAFLNQLAQP